MERQADRIRTSYGELATVNGHATGVLFGAGYGKDAGLAALADQAAEMLADAFPDWQIVKRGNSGGKDAAALADFYDKDGKLHCAKLGAFHPCHCADPGDYRSPLIYSDGVMFDAMFPTRFDNAEAAAEYPAELGTEYRRSWSGDYGSVSRTFPTLAAGLDWLRVNVPRYFPSELTQTRPAPKAAR